MGGGDSDEVGFHGGRGIGVDRQGGGLCRFLLLGGEMEYGICYLYPE